jgi:GNAT superfamily N-acetyltransferase
MTPDDLALGLRLSAQSGWNQTAADWRRALELGPGGCFVAELDGGVPAGTVATCSFGPIAWIALVLVDAPHRRQGIGAALVRHALAHLDAAGIRTIRLDATPLGQPLYEQLGFVPEYGMTRYEGVPTPAADFPTGVTVTPAAQDQLETIIAMDRAATGTDRRTFLSRLFAEQPERMLVAVQNDGRLAGYLASRPGARAIQVGPCVGAGDAGATLLAHALHQLMGQKVFVDVPDENAASIGIVKSTGLTPQRSFVRMCRGPRVVDRPNELWACAGPEKG